MRSRLESALARAATRLGRQARGLWSETAMGRLALFAMIAAITSLVMRETPKLEPVDASILAFAAFTLVASFVALFRVLLTSRG